MLAQVQDPEKAARLSGLRENAGQAGEEGRPVIMMGFIPRGEN